MGFNIQGFLIDLEKGLLTKRVNVLVEKWLTRKITMEIIPSTSYIETKRKWQCSIDQIGEASIPCGGTHLANFDKIKKIDVAIALEDPPDQSSKATHLVVVSRVG
jgi:alanyl-tRNA synthetase